MLCKRPLIALVALEPRSRSRSGIASRYSIWRDRRDLPLSGRFCHSGAFPLSLTMRPCLGIFCYPRMFSFIRPSPRDGLVSALQHLAGNRVFGGPPSTAELSAAVEIALLWAPGGPPYVLKRNNDVSDTRASFGQRKAAVPRVDQKELSGGDAWLAGAPNDGTTVRRAPNLERRIDQADFTHRATSVAMMEKQRGSCFGLAVRDAAFRRGLQANRL